MNISFALLVKDTIFFTFTELRYKTLRYILVILSIWFYGIANAQMYRVFFVDKPTITEGREPYEIPVPTAYIRSLKEEVDSIWMVSNWLNYALVSDQKFPVHLLNFSFVKRVEQIDPLKSVSLQVEEVDTGDNSTLEQTRQWQLDTMGYPFFKEKNLDGKGIVIAIIDAGFSGANESKAFTEIFSSHRVLKTWDFIENDTNVFHGATHGTGVWSCIAGNMPGKQTGLATGASFILLRSEDQKTETMADEDRWIQAIEKAFVWGANIVNSSVGFSDVLHKLSDVNGQSLISKAADIATKKGMLVVVSAGNEYITIWKTLCIPADADGVISVGAIDKEGNHSYFSSVGPTADGRNKPDVVAPGTCVVVKGNDLVIGNGTSYAAPLVTGYLACMLELKGKNNFTKDSLNHYSGLYPYCDYVYGYGVPSAPRKTVNSEFGHIKCNGPEVDKRKGIISNNLILSTLNPTGEEIIFLKITGVNGEIKFSKRIKLKGSQSFKIPTTRKKALFIYSKYFNPMETDKWLIWDAYCTYEY